MTLLVDNQLPLALARYLAASVVRGGFQLHLRNHSR